MFPADLPSTLSDPIRRYFFFAVASFFTSFCFFFLSEAFGLLSPTRLPPQED